MFFKILAVAATLAVASAQYHDGYNHGHGHGHAVSSQNVVLHQTHGHSHGHAAPVIAHHTPIIAHHNPIIAHHTPVIAHHTPVIAHAPIVHHQPIHYSSGHHEEHHAPAHYAFEYSVNDPHTGDIKSQKETRKGDVVHGSYSLHEADGTVRVVDYTADHHSGSLLFAAVLGVAAAQHHHANSGHAVSSQNVVLHQTHGHANHASVAHHQPVHHSEGHHEHHHDYYAPPHYSFDYSVKDTHTGDIKSQQETREGDKTHGFYSFHEADGTIRRVDYTVDKHSGFNAVVHREGHATHAASAHH